jgi:hypothetical protein
MRRTVTRSRSDRRLQLRSHLLHGCDVLRQRYRGRLPCLRRAAEHLAEQELDRHKLRAYVRHRRRDARALTTALAPAGEPDGRTAGPLPLRATTSSVGPRGCRRGRCLGGLVGPDVEDAGCGDAAGRRFEDRTHVRDARRGADPPRSVAGLFQKLVRRRRQSGSHVRAGARATGQRGFPADLRPRRGCAPSAPPST